MTGHQRRLYTAALAIGRAFGTGGRSWTPITASAGVLSVGAVLTLAIVENNLIRPAPALPASAIYNAPWWGIGNDAIEPETTLVNDAGLAFICTGVADSSQGFYLTPLARASNPLLPSVLSLTRQGLQIGMRQGM